MLWLVCKIKEDTEVTSVGKTTIIVIQKWRFLELSVGKIWSWSFQDIFLWLALCLSLSLFSLLLFLNSRIQWKFEAAIRTLSKMFLDKPKFQTLSHICLIFFCDKETTTRSILSTKTRFEAVLFKIFWDKSRHFKYLLLQA